MLKARMAAVLCCLLAASALVSCGEKNISVSDVTTTEAATQAATNEPVAIGSDVRNFTAPQDGEEVVVLTVKGYGNIRIKLFPEYAEKGVENFKTLAEQGYYNGIIFHRIINKFMIQGGDPTGTGRGGSSIWGSKFEGGTDPHLVHVAGAVAYANSGATSTNGSQFYIVTGQTFTEDQFAPTYPESAKEAYLKAGGYPWLDGGYTVFGQVYDGLDVVFKLQQVQTDSSDKPLTDVVIESMRVEKYDGRAMKWYTTDYPGLRSAETTTEASSMASSETTGEASSEAASTTAESEQQTTTTETTTAELQTSTETTTTGASPADAQ